MFDCEECANQALVVGIPNQIADMNHVWGQWLANLDQINDELARYKKDIAASFTGKAGDAYQQHLTGLQQQIDTLRSEHAPVQPLLSVAEESLRKAQAAMPVPVPVLNEVLVRR